MWNDREIPRPYPTLDQTGEEEEERSVNARRPHEAHADHGTASVGAELADFSIPDQPEDLMTDQTCRYGNSHDGEEHECPFQSDVHNDTTFQCSCCQACTRDCLDDI